MGGHMGDVLRRAAIAVAAAWRTVAVSGLLFVIVSLTPSRAQAVVVDTSTSATFSFDLVPGPTRPYPVLGFTVQFNEANVVDRGERFRLTFFNKLSDPALNFVSVLADQQVTVFTDDIGLFPELPPDTTGFVVISAEIGSFDVDRLVIFDLLHTAGVDAQLVSSVPEPATLVLFSIGLAGLGFSSRKRMANKNAFPCTA
jgi:PEP-CTERM motif